MPTQATPSQFRNAAKGKITKLPRGKGYNLFNAPNRTPKSQIKSDGGKG
jgi:hypothetical protein